MKKVTLAAALLASFGTTGCAALLGAGVGAGAVACAPDDVNCVEEAEEVVEDVTP